MERHSDPQLELFSGQAAYGDSNKEKPRNSFWRHIRSYEKAILMIISFITISIISFSLGVEKGKRIVSSNTLLERAALSAPGQQKEPLVEKKQEESLEVPGASVNKDATSLQKTRDSYTIQLASYKMETYARKEGELLKKKGLSPVFLNKGNYVVLCVGNFSNRNEAESLLSEIKKQKRYSGCLIRRL